MSSRGVCEIYGLGHLAIGLALSLGSLNALAQHGIQQKRVSGVGLQTRLIKGNAKTKCLNWMPLRPSQTLARYVEQDSSGNEGITIQVSAMVNKGATDCDVSFDNPEIIKEVGSRTHSSGSKIRDFEIFVSPPAAILKASTASIEEELVLETPIDVNSDRGFFEFFSRSTIYFENRFAVLTTDSPSTSVRALRIFPVFGGKISSPLPLLDHWFGGYMLFQNLGNFLPHTNADVAYSEFLFDLTYQRIWESTGIQFGLAGELRGRNVYQVSTNRPFVVGQVLRPGIAAKFTWFPSYYSGFGRSKLRFGVEAEYHFLDIAPVPGSDISQQTWEATLQYRMTPRGAYVIGVGYSQFLQSALIPQLSASRIHENTKNFFLRLSLFPVLATKGGNE